MFCFQRRFKTTGIPVFNKYFAQLIPKALLRIKVFKRPSEQKKMANNFPFPERFKIGMTHTGYPPA